ncbi:formate dehydrogenase subunit delta [Sphingobium bisphenolivorans]|uniref:formate dehydrogenase subunit delta n=1 Tax=Sphingobium bisphenolivorans TaxID=1335760 RepID=UPI0003B392AF|nr:formate dehydrogenase subunit delta [Sphingobium bisphenolivorans]
MSDEPHVMSTTQRLVYMAEQIARNFAALGEDRTVTALAEHLTSYWDPHMKDQIVAIARDHPDSLSPPVAAAVARLAQGRTPAGPNPAQFNAVDEVGHCDAG